MPDFLLEQQARFNGARIICGVDEVGRGPLAGPVMAAAAIIPVDHNGAPDLPDTILNPLNDSKKLTAKVRAELFEPLTRLLPYGVGIVDPAEIDAINILQATFRAMAMAVDTLPTAPDLALIDGNKVPPGLPCRGEPVIKGDGISLSIAASHKTSPAMAGNAMRAMAPWNTARPSPPTD